MRLKTLFQLLITLSLFIGQIQARVVGRGATPGGNNGDVGAIGIAGDGSPRDEVQADTYDGGQGRDCKPNEPTGFVSLSFLRNLADPSVSDENTFKIIKLSGGAFRVEMPKYSTACTDLRLVKSTARSNIFIRIKNEYDFTESVDLKDGESLATLSDEEKYFRCMEKKGLLKNGSIDRVKIQEDGLVSNGKTFGPYSYDTGDGQESVNVYYSSDIRSGHDRFFGASEVSPKPADWLCFAHENFNTKEPTRLYVSQRDKVYDRAMKVCQSDSAEQILEELSRLRSSSVGNFQELQNILKKAFESKQEERVGTIYDRMNDIENEMKPDKDGKVPSESIVEDRAKEYQALAKELNKIVLQPSIQEIDYLLKTRTNANKDEVDSKVKDLNQKISKFSQRPFDNLSFLYDALKEYAITEPARDIESLRLASHYYGKVYMGEEDKRGRQLEVDDAAKRIESLISSFERDQLNVWEADYATKRGSKAPIRAVTNEIRGRKKSMDARYKRFQENEQRNMRAYCGSNMIGGMKNPVRCRSWMSGKDQRMRTMLNQRSRDLAALRTSTDNYSRFMNNFEEFQLRQIETRDESDPFNFYSTGGYGNDYDIYGNPNDFSSDFSWMYSMQNQGGMPGMQQPGMMGPARSPIIAPGMNMQQNQFMAQPNPYAVPFR